MKKKVCLIQVGYLQNRESFFPLAAGMLMAYAKSKETIRSAYFFDDIIFRRENTDVLTEKTDAPAVAAFSCYLWNFEYNKVLAAKLKKKNPDCFIIFGGHQITPESDLMSEAPYVDCLIFGEGEEVFASVLEALNEKTDMESIPNIRFRRNGEIITTRPKKMTGTDYPSPYLTGCFDALIRKNGNIFRNMYIETNRGCPFSCAYCDWGCTKKDVKMFPTERILAEIDWAAEHDIDLFGICDANFGMFERDLLITDHIVEAHERTGCFRSFQTSFFEDTSDRVFEISKKLEKAGINKGITLSLQSLNDETLKNVGRKNLSLDKFTHALEYYKANNITTYSEFIMGLPGETKESFVDGINTLLMLGQHTCIYIHNCELLPGSPMAQQDYLKKHGIRTDRLILNQPHRDVDDRAGIPEYSNIVTSTKTLPKEDWAWLNTFSAVVQAFHFGGVLKLAAIWLYKRADVSYKDFYSGLVSLMSDRDNGSDAVSEIRERFEGIPDKYADLTFYDPGLAGHTLSADEYLILTAVKDTGSFFKAVDAYLLSFSDSEEFIELLKFQKKMLNRPGLLPFTLDCEYDFLNWFTAVLAGEDVCAPTKRKTRYYVEPTNYSMADYAKYVVWYGKKTADKNLFSDITSVSYEE